MSIIDILTTGGTIDKIYFDQKSAYEVGDPIIGPLLTSMNVGFDFTVEQLMRVDSLDMTDADRFILYERTKRSSSQQVLITHGTDGMIKTAQRLSNKGQDHRFDGIIAAGSVCPQRRGFQYRRRGERGSNPSLWGLPCNEWADFHPRHRG